MLELQDIPTVWYIRVGVWIIRFLRKIGFKRVTRNFRDRSMLGIIAKLHLDSIHKIRTFSIEKYITGNLDEANPHGPFENLANAHRDTFLEILELSPQKLHCTIKICNGNANLKKEGLFGISRGEL